VNHGRDQDPGNSRLFKIFIGWLREDFRPDDHPDRVDGLEWKDIKEMITKQDGP
jgi:hypothetical protein